MSAHIYSDQRSDSITQLLFPSLLPYVRAAFCGMGLSLCSVQKEFDQFSKKQTPIVCARHDIDIGLTSNGH